MVVWHVTKIIENDNNKYVFARFYNAHMEGEDLVRDDIIDEMRLKIPGKNRTNWTPIINKLNAEANKR